MYRLRLIGTPALIAPEATAISLERKDAALLAVLAIEGEVSRDWLAAMLWPDVPLKTANNSFRQRVFRLRRRCSHELVRTGDLVRLADGVVHDAVRSPIVAADPAGLPDGEFLGGHDYGADGSLSDWVRTQRERWRAFWRDALTAAAARHETQGELARSIELTLRLVSDEPLDERAQRRLMRLHYLRGDRAAAILAFESFERVLKDDLGARPDTETLELLATIELSRPRPLARRAVVPASLRRPPRLIGREAELGAMDAARAADRVFLLLGEAGMGKSRVLQEYLGAHSGTLFAQARPGDATVPFALLARLLRAVLEVAGQAVESAEPSTRRELARVLPELGVGLTISGEGQRLVMQRAVELVLAAARDAGVSTVLIDDLHFADAASLEMLQSLVGSDRLVGLHWGLAQRPGEGDAAVRALVGAVDETQRLQRVLLPPLDAGAMLALIESLGLPGLDAAALAAPLVRHTGGNPLFALETLKDVVLSGAPGPAELPQPATVASLIERRLRQLSPAALALARVAALAGTDFSIEVAEQVLKTPALALADAWSELEAAQVLHGAAFAHDLVHDVALRSVPAEVARHTHAALAGLLAGRGAEPARIAEHWRAAGRWAEAARQFEAAAVRARQTSRLVEARDLWAAAVQCFERAGDRKGRFAAEARRVDVLLFTDGIEPARAITDRLLGEAADASEQIAALAVRAQAHLIAGEWQATIDVAHRAVALAQQLRQPALAIDCQRQIGVALSQAGSAADAVARLRDAEPLVESQGTLTQRYEHRAALAYALNAADQPRASAQALEQACALAGEAGDLAEVMASTSNLAGAVSALGRIDQALTLARQAHALTDRLGDPGGLQPTVNLMNLGMFAAQLGRYREALAALEQALAGLRRVGSTMWVGTAENHLAALWITLGQTARAVPLLASDAADANPSTASRRELLRARVDRLHGRDATGRLTGELARLQPRTKPRVLFGIRLELSRMLPTVEALDVVRAVRRAAAEVEYEGMVLHALAREVDCLTAIDPGHAAELAGEAVSRSDGCWPTDGYLPEVWLVCARALRAAGRPVEAHALVDRGRAWIDAAATEHLDPPLRAAFRTRNPVNRELLALAGVGARTSGSQPSGASVTRE
jgi:DNA-binding SARP family transcriptional activator/tetratricopeptide (TPR) repeat protein